MIYRKPERLHIDDAVAIVSPSWGGPSVFPHIYDLGIALLQAWGLRVVEYPTARMPAVELAAHPELRAADINRAFADPDIKAVIASIGGNDSVRILPYLDPAVIAANPKILLGYSDTTTVHVFCNLQGLVTLHGPSVMAGIAQMAAMPEYAIHLREMLFVPADQHRYQPYAKYSDGYPDWRHAAKAGQVNETQSHEGWRLLQGRGTVEGTLFGGCIDVLEMVRATPFWPAPDFWTGKILFLETSEEAPSVETVEAMLRGYGMLGLWGRVAGLLLGRAARYSDADKLALEQAALTVIRDEFGRADLPIIANMDFGHTDPQMVLPLGVKARIDCAPLAFQLIESWLR